MPVFTYQGKDAAGEKVQGERAAENKQVLRSALGRERHQGRQDQGKGEEPQSFSFGGGKVKPRNWPFSSASFR